MITDVHERSVAQTNYPLYVDELRPQGVSSAPGKPVSPASAERFHEALFNVTVKFLAVQEVHAQSNMTWTTSLRPRCYS